MQRMLKVLLTVIMQSVGNMRTRVDAKNGRGRTVRPSPIHLVNRRRPHDDMIAGTVSVAYPTWAMMSAAFF